MKIFLPNSTILILIVTRTRSIGTSRPISKFCRGGSKKNVEYRVPPPKDKRSLQYKYETLSMKRMKDILKQSKEDKASKYHSVDARSAPRVRGGVGGFKTFS